MTDTLAQQLLEARLKGHSLAHNHYPTTMAEAYQIQQSISDLSDCQVTGYKIGATTDHTMELLGVTEPIYGPLFNQYCFDSGVTLPIHNGHGVHVETEFVIGLKHAVSCARGPVSVDELREATAWVAGGFELIGSRYKTLPEKRGLCAIADSGSNVAMVTGERVSKWQHLELQRSKVSLLINDKQVATGHSGMSVAGDPISMAAWLVNHPQMQQRGLLAGEMISCGTCTGVIPVRSGDRLLAQFEDLPDLELQLSDAN